MSVGMVGYGSRDEVVMGDGVEGDGGLNEVCSYRWGVVVDEWGY